MKFSLFIVCVLLLLNEGKCKLDFSQFHLPPCCFISSPETFSGYAARSSAPTKRETPQEKVDNRALHENLRSIEVLQNGSVKVNSENMNTRKMPNTKIQFYSLIVPMEDLVNTKQSSSMGQHRRPTTTGRILFPKGKFDATDNSREHSEHAASKILEKIFSMELGFDDKTKRIIKRKSAETFERDDKEDGTKHAFPSKRLINQYVNWESKRLTNPIDFPGKDDTTTRQQGLQDSATEHQEEVVKRIPSSWIKYLKRALYQSLTDGKGLIVDEGEGLGTFHNRKSVQNKIVKSKIRFPDTWKAIKSAKLQYVDRMARVSTTPYGAIYLPPTGPIVSGILVNSPDGFFHLRVASELYFPGQAFEQNCGCYLLRPGEILVAYWSVSRIFKENGLPALQYLVYPLPYSVPTPPEFLPFSNSAMFYPSEIDPLNNFFENIQHSANYIDSEKNGPPPPPQDHHPSLNYASKGHGHTMTRNPKPIQPFPNDELFLEHFNQQIQIGQINPSPHPYQNPIQQGPSSVPSGIGVVEQVPIPQPQQQLGVNVFLDNGQQIPPPELLAQYQQLALQNAFKNQFHNGQNIPFHSIPYNDLLIGQGPIQYEQPTQLPPPPQPSIPPLSLGQQEGVSVNNFQLPVRANPSDPPPEENVQISKPPTGFPNSIQDIISPQDLQPQQQPLRSEQMTPPSTAQDISGVVEQPTPNGIPYPFILGQIPFLVNYPPHFPPAYMDFNPLQHGIQHHNAGLQNPQQHHIIKQADGNDDKKSSSHDSDKKTEDRKEEQANKNEDQVKHSQQPFVVTNIMDNEKKYYPVRLSQRNNPRKEYEKYRYERQRRFRKQKLVNDINKKGGYILDF